MECTRQLRYGMRGEDVRQAKDRLVRLGFLAKSTHDTFGADTRAAVRAFQRANGLSADGIVGPETWAALLGTDAPAKKAEPSALANAVCALARTRIGDLYVWGASGQSDLSDGAIRARDKEAERAIRFRDKQKKRGITDLLAHDCSGFVSWLFRKTGAWGDTGDTRRDCDGLWGYCSPIGKAALIAGDLVFRGADADKTHIGLYLGGGRVIHCKGRDAGVVLEGIDEGGTGYWQSFGRCRLLNQENTI